MPGEDTVGSPLVAIVTPVTLPAVALPMVKPITVTVTAVLALIEWPWIVMTIRVLFGVATEPAGGPVPLICTQGVPLLAKKPGG